MPCYTLVMNIKFLGTGGAFDWQYGTSAATVQTKDTLFLVDCGPSAFPQLMKHELIDKIDYVVLTHLHGDHVGSLFQVLCQRSIMGLATPILSPSDVFTETIAQLLDLQRFDRERDNFIPINNVPTISALDTTGQHVPDMLNYAYYFSEDDELIYYSGDIGRIETAVDFLKDRTESNIRVFHDAHHLNGLSHTHYTVVNEQLKNYETYLYHCNPEKIPADNTMPLVSSVPELNW